MFFTTGKGEIVKDAYADERFNKDVDEQTGYVTNSILCGAHTDGQPSGDRGFPDSQSHRRGFYGKRP